MVQYRKKKHDTSILVVAWNCFPNTIVNFSDRNSRKWWKQSRCKNHFSAIMIILSSVPLSSQWLIFINIFKYILSSTHKQTQNEVQWYYLFYEPTCYIQLNVCLSVHYANLVFNLELPNLAYYLMVFLDGRRFLKGFGVRDRERAFFI